MSPTLLDTDILSWYLRGNPNVVEACTAYRKKYNTLHFSIITYYEILSGLRFRNAWRQEEHFLKMTEQCTILPLTSEACKIAAEAYAQVRKAGTPVDDIDLLIAGIALSNNQAISTHNVRHFEKIPNLEINDWFKPIMPKH